jgi:VanZ family protein
VTHPLKVRRWAAATFAVALVVWTWKLLEPHPVPDTWLGDLRSWLELLPFLLAKLLHGSAYALLAVLALVWSPPRWRAAVVVFLMLHGVATEVLQEVLPFNRTGRVADVAIDWAGIAGGVIAYRLYCRVTSHREAERDASQSETHAVGGE